MRRKKRPTSNPLSKARGKQYAPESIWFRRSGIGVQLFVQYYAHQNPHTVSPLDKNQDQNQDSSDCISQKQKLQPQNTPPPPPSFMSGNGMSRAAKRRRKKKEIKNDGAHGVIIDNDAGDTNQDPLEKHALDSQKHDDERKREGKQLCEKIAISSDIHVTSSKIYAVSLLQPFSNLVKTYKAWHIAPFLEAISKPLPLTFRRRLTADIQEFNNAFSSFTDKFSLLSQKLDSDYQIYKGSMSKNALSNHDAPQLKDFLFTYSQNGFIARQELGSILPVLALQKAGVLTKRSFVLDVCASPGSKTLQALEVIGEHGRILANDVSETRLQALREAISRSGMPKRLTDRISYSCQDASETNFQNPWDSNRSWDAVICDVPCSGDGTCRKDKHILPMWMPQQANHLHTTQLQILIQCLRSVPAGTVVCYSTCSLNPVENEAVVAAALTNLERQASKPKPLKESSSSLSSPSSPMVVELMECCALPGITLRPGISDWKVAHYDGKPHARTEDDQDEDDHSHDHHGGEKEKEEEDAAHLRWFPSWESAVQGDMENPMKTLWPPLDAHRLHLERCRRLWPQDQDSGGFFFALLRKMR